MHLLKADYDMAYDVPCMHEFVMDLGHLKHETGVSAMDIAKGLLDLGIHPPTMYFPLIVHEALMIEPTETESKAIIEEVAGLFHQLVVTARENPSVLQNAPSKTPVGRLDEVAAARRPILRWS